MTPDRTLLMQLEAKVRCIADEFEMTSASEIEALRQSVRVDEFMKATEPFRAMKVKIAGFQIVERFVIDKDGQILEAIYWPRPPEVMQALKAIDEEITLEAHRFGLPA